MQIRAHGLELIELTAGDQDDLAPGGNQLLNGSGGFGEDGTFGGQGSVVISAESEVAHRAPGLASSMPLEVCDFSRGGDRRRARTVGSAPGGAAADSVNYF